MSDQALFAAASLGSPADHPQWRLQEVQLANWGTFDGQIYRVPVARSGHLITGSSGSGKSTLLDAIAAVLTPDKWLRFNAAAQGLGPRTDQRSAVSYVRGAWQRQADADEDRIVTQYLRPKATWSGVLLQYGNGKGDTVSLARFFFAKGTGTGAADISSIRFLDQRAVDLADLQEFARSGLQTRRVKEAFPKATVTPIGTHAAFFARLRTVFGIRNEAALSLLHKTQSTKNLGSLDQLFREYMLDAPETFRVADNAIAQFGELSDAHDHVVELRKQRDLLKLLRDASGEYEKATVELERAGLLSQNVPLFRAQLELDLKESELASIAQKSNGLKESAILADAAYAEASERRDSAYKASVDSGASLATQAKERLDDALEDQKRVENQWEKFQRLLGEAGIAHAPLSSTEFLELRTQVDQTLQSTDEPSGATHAELERLTSARKLDEKLEAELNSLLRSRSTVPERLQTIRAALAEHLGVPPSAIPFAAEMMEVKPEYAEWTGAIERVVRPLALTLLVRSRHLGAVRRWVDVNNLGARLAYEEVTEGPHVVKASSSELSLVNRVQVAAGPFQDWVEAVLSQRFDYACVNAPDDLGRYQRSVTMNGQIRQSSTRYLKDDRHAVSNRRHWLLGNTEAKMESLVADRKRAREELERAQEVVALADRRLKQQLTQVATLKFVRSYEWSEVDVRGAAQKVAARRQRLEELLAPNEELQSLLNALTVAEEELARTLKNRTEIQAELGALEMRRKALESALAHLQSARETTIDEDVSQELHRRFHARRRTLSEAALSEETQRVAAELRREETAAQTQTRMAAEEISQVATRFKERWPGTASSLTASVEDRGSFLEIYDNIVAQGLPEHEGKFLRLLRERSRDLVGDLRSEIMGAAAAVREKIVPINDSLMRSEYDDGRYLRLRVRSTRPSAAEEFLAELKEISEGSWGDSDLEAAERRFSILSRMMTDLGSSEPQKKAWRRQCLDTRLHVSFIAEEIDWEGRELSSHESGTALSGGQQQKLVFFCLAAALRYQLADYDQPFPSYATVVLDEAFDKADANYTRTALGVFEVFGLHLVLATPQKLLQTIEPFIGGITEIENPSKKRSLVSALMWEES